MADQNKDNLLHISWQDSMWVPHLNASNIMNYFGERSNPFYSRECNNEFIKMQQNTRVDQLTHMQGIEYILLHTQEPILYIVRKQQRYSPTQVTPLANYHIIGGQVFQTPDLGSIINSRLLACVSNLNGAFSEMQMYTHYHPSKGYWWQFRNQQDQEQQKKDKEKKAANQGIREEPASPFQQRRVDSLLKDLSARFPYKNPPHMQPQHLQQNTQQQPPPQQQQPQPEVPIKPEDIKQEIKQEMPTEIKTEIKTEPGEVKVKIEPGTQPVPQRTSKPPPEKRQRTGL